MEQASGQRPLRADAERTVQAILEAAERVLSADPAATMEQIARAAGVARTTVHRRFTSRDALVDALAEWAARQFHDAVASAHPDSAPPLVALYQVTANVLRVKLGWGFAMGRSGPGNPEVDRVHAEVIEQCGGLFRRAQEHGVLRPDVDPEWARRVYYALIHEATRERSHSKAPERVDELATRVVDTLLQGVGQEGPPLTRDSGPKGTPRS
ncbi:TetR/AcrR family transcriptional regulator [Streptomyces triticagri]|uniref:TetR/AcrR family transcriptional regulator n=1 Tax=Streptomyces triticagri TaxID=2293568 RepID=A0A372M5X7_9ACTN|nr:TetR/AcrR family transcriptional regulator [Streptomyces triticagri]RFU86261.1 TetR/AcrR family transcriptional regulator [Streptomyces triticagri]